MLKYHEIKDPAKAFLIRARTIMQEIQMQQMEVARCRDRGTTVMYSTQAQGKNTGAKLNATETAFVNASTAARDIEERYQQLMDVKHEIDMVINKVLDGRLRLLLKSRYVQCAGWKEVADVLGCVETYAKGYLHKDALNAVRALIK